MDLTVVQYLIFILASLILIGVVIEFNKHLSRRDKSRTEALNSWVELDTTRQETREKLPVREVELDDEEDEEIEELHARARQNGHHTESQKPQI